MYLQDQNKFWGSRISSLLYVITNLKKAIEK